ncbi:MAG: HesA/MoeB/ThiF family protein [Bacteroidetes bacterium]|nr:HesA/MoeB/ThiF family protein [Bacteroidota bacterium]
MQYEENDKERYACQLQMKDFGSEAQDKLKNGSVLVIGAGGLGCPVLQYLAGAGVGRIGIVDDDHIELGNLHRQVLYTTEDIGKSKTESAAAQLRKMNPAILIEPHPFRITNKEAINLLTQYDLIIDGSDNFATRFMINDACALLKKPLIFGAIGSIEGQIGFFNHTTDQPSANLRDLYPTLLPEEAALSCRDSGTIGVVPGVIGTMMAAEAIKFFTQKGTLLSNQLLTYNFYTHQTCRFDISPSKHELSNRPITAEAFLQKDYLQYISINQDWKEISAETMEILIEKENSLLIDIRSEAEYPPIQIEPHLRISVEDILNETDKLKEAEHLIVICSSGNRSKLGADILQKHFGTAKKIYSLKGGIQAWKNKSRIFS